MSRNVILFELNEVPWRVVDDYVEHNPDSVLARTLPRSVCFDTVAADLGHLSPWTTWPTLHRGVNGEMHMIGDLGQDHTKADAAYPPIWELLHDAGVPVGVCGSLHSFPPPKDLQDYSFYLPDAFATDPVAHPAELSDFQLFNLKMARESARNVDTSVPVKDALKVLAKSAVLGIRPQTYAALAVQLVAERRRPSQSTRRRTFHALLAFDVYLKQLRTTRPAFSTFFSNHVASAMHRYWAATYPGDYKKLMLGPDWIERFRDEIPWAMDQANAMVGRLVKFVDANPEYQLWIASSMGQGPTIARPLETTVYLTDFMKFMSALGLPEDRGWERRPAMLPQANVVVEDEFRERFEAGLDTLKLRGKPVRYRKTDAGFYSMDFGQHNLHSFQTPVRFRSDRHSLVSFGLSAVEIADRSDTTAYHVSGGILAVYDGADRSNRPTVRSSVSTLSIAPALLKNFGVAPRDYTVSGEELAGVFA